MNSFLYDGFIFVPKFLSKEKSKNLAIEFRHLLSEGNFWQDSQCPLSFGMYGTKLFDKLLEDVLPDVSKIVGKKLLPTYSYARLYKPNEELKNHVDRPACEYSISITLDFEGDTWPIYMGNADKSNSTELKMNVGDAVIYRGTKKYHWREKYTEGKWQIQVFLHYVDADGPYTDEIYDRRTTLKHNEVHSTQEILYWHFTNAFTPSECKKFIKTYDAEMEDARIGDTSNEVVDKSYRDASRVSLNSYQGLGATLAGIGMSANVQAWDFDIKYANQCEILRYDKNGHYDVHKDTMLEPNAYCRKLTILAFLNDEFEGGKFFIQVGREKIYPPQTKGSVIVFPSFLLHGVEDVTEGVRYSAVCWMAGPFFK